MWVLKLNWFFKVLESTLFWWVFLFSYQRSHIIRTIAVPSESLLNELRIVEVSHLDKATLAMGYTCRLCYWLTMYYSSYASICIFLELQCSLRKGKSLWCFVFSLPHLPIVLVLLLVWLRVPVLWKFYFTRWKQNAKLLLLIQTSTLDTCFLQYED